MIKALFVASVCYIALLQVTGAASEKSAQVDYLALLLLRVNTIQLSEACAASGHPTHFLEKSIEEEYNFIELKCQKPFLSEKWISSQTTFCFCLKFRKILFSHGRRFLCMSHAF